MKNCQHIKKTCKDKLNNKMLFKILSSILDSNKHTNIGRKLLLLFNKICLAKENIFDDNLFT